MKGLSPDEIALKTKHEDETRSSAPRRPLRNTPRGSYQSADPEDATIWLVQSRPGAKRFNVCRPLDAKPSELWHPRRASSRKAVSCPQLKPAVPAAKTQPSIHKSWIASQAKRTLKF